MVGEVDEDSQQQQQQQQILSSSPRLKQVKVKNQNGNSEACGSHVLTLSVVVTNAVYVESALLLIRLMNLCWMHSKTRLKRSRLG